MLKQRIKALVMDVDGTMTDGRIYMSASGEIMKAFDIKDGYMIAHLSSYDIMPIIITGRKSKIVSNRCKELNITEVYQDIQNKLECLIRILKIYQIDLKEVAYIGDDLNDKECMEACGFSGCPANAVPEILQCVNYVCEKEGGNGAVREFIEQIIKYNNNNGC